MSANQLQYETSPYLLQHAQNPVNWLPWSTSVFERAQKENKLVLISIGYSACHWCHVMEHESFSDTQVAELMNEHFLCIKVDREERPDVDHLYMMAVQMMTGRGGWPLNCFTLPNGLPVFGGTYFQKPQWIEILNALQDAHQKTPEKLKEFAEKLKAGIKENDFIATKRTEQLNQAPLIQAVDRWKARFDKIHGGLQRAPKFPLPASWEFLLNYGILNKDTAVLEHVAFTLEKISLGGIYDHAGGGFFRYSVDEEWMVPHFEKMLYDNAQLASLYADAWMHYKNPRFKKVLNQTLHCLERDFKAENGGFYAAYDADSEGEEGKYYVWSTEEINNISSPANELFKEYYHILPNGNWEKKNILHAEKSLKDFSNAHDVDEESTEIAFDEVLDKLHKQRMLRVQPLKDTKQLAAWNGMALKAFAKGYESTGNPHYLEVAEGISKFIENELMKKDGRLQRKYVPDKSFNYGFLDDYAFVTTGLIEMYLATFEVRYLQKADRIINFCLTHFYHPESGMFYYTEKANKELFDRKMELSDTVIPSSNSEMATALFYLGMLLQNSKYRELATQMTRNMASTVFENPSYYANWCNQMLRSLFPFNEIVATGKNAEELLEKLHNRHYPNAYFVATEEANSLKIFENRVSPVKSQLFICTDHQCGLPVGKTEEAREKINALYGF